MTKNIFIAILCLMPNFLIAQELLLFGGSGNKEFLGCLNCSEYSSNSVWNNYSTYGWGNSYGIWNPYGNFGGKYSSYSACNEYSSNGPVIVDREGKFYGTLSINEYVSGSVCGVLGNAQICRALKAMCSKN
jgi:hypothetical protein